jgi:ABC-type transport system involved in multi-copper enzyme maturation permease subunit
MSAGLLHYRPWRGRFQEPVWTIWPIARIALWMIFRRRVFWFLYGLGLLIFMMFFFGQYLLSWARTQMTEDTVRVGFVPLNPTWLIERLRDGLKLNGTGEMFRNFFWYQGYMVMVVLALTGSILVGNDFQFGSLPFYLAKPLERWHYLLGKCLAVGVFINLLTTAPALILFVQVGLDTPNYFAGNSRLLAGILAYGLLLTVTLSLMIVAAATWLRRVVPMVMVWATAFVFSSRVTSTLVGPLHYNARWRLIDLWNNLYIVGNACLGMDHESLRTGPQPAVWEAAFVLGALTLLCVMYLNLRIRAVEIVR